MYIKEMQNNNIYNKTMDFQVIIENYQENENSPGSYEKKFKSNTTIKDVLQEFGFDSAYVVNVQQEIIKP